jgi:hypothetical protein
MFAVIVLMKLEEAVFELASKLFWEDFGFINADPPMIYDWFLLSPFLDTLTLEAFWLLPVSYPEFPVFFSTLC